MQNLNNQKTTNLLVFWSGILGNILDHYDVALYLYLAPFIAPVFFNETDPVVNLIMVYGLTSTTILTRPLGSLCFGKMAMNYGAKMSMITTLLGVAVTTSIIGCIPSYNDVGYYAPIFLVIVRMMQGFFAAGEQSVAALFIMEHCKEKDHAKASSYYNCSTMTGIMLASIVATFVSSSDDPSFYWRVAFISSGLTGFVCLWIRYLVNKIPVNSTAKYEESKSDKKVIMHNKWLLIKIMLVSGFSYMTYTVPFVFMNKFIPMITDISDLDMLKHNNIFFIIDIALLPVCGFIAAKFEYHKWMASMSFLICVTIIPIFSMLPGASFVEVIALKAWIVVIGVGFSAPLNAWFFRLLAGKEKYVITGVGYALGVEIFGRNVTAICWWIYHRYDNITLIASYLCCISLFATISLLIPNKTKAK